MREVFTAGGIVKEREGVHTYIWLIVNKEIAEAHKADPRVPLKYQLPKGTMKPGESERDTAAREILEELGIIAMAGELVVRYKAPRQSYDEDGVPQDVVMKDVAVYLMEHVRDLLLQPEEMRVRILVNKGLLPKMYYPEDALVIAGHFGLTMPAEMQTTA